MRSKADPDSPIACRGISVQHLRRLCKLSIETTSRLRLGGCQGLALIRGVVDELSCAYRNVTGLVYCAGMCRRKAVAVTAGEKVRNSTARSVLWHAGGLGAFSARAGPCCRSRGFPRHGGSRKTGVYGRFPCLSSGAGIASIQVKPGRRALIPVLDLIGPPEVTWHKI